MSAVLRAVTWEFWRENRWWIAIAVCAIFALGALLYQKEKIWPAYDQQQELNSEFVLLEMIIFGWLLCMGQYNKSKARLGFHEHLFTKPIRMRSVVLWRLCLAGTTVTLLYLLTAWIIFLATSLKWPILLPCLYIVASISCIQALAWSLPAELALQLLLSSIVYIVLYVRYYNHLESMAAGGPTLSFTPDILILMALAAGLALAGVALDRRSQHLSLAVLWNRIQLLLITCLPWKTCTGKTPQQALFWFHWIRKGWVLPFISLITIILGYVLCLIYRENASAILQDYFSSIFILNIAGFPFLAGLILCQQETRNQGMPAYVGCLPVSNQSMLWAYAKAMFVSLFLSWTIYALGLGLLYITLIVTGHGQIMDNLLHDLNEIAKGFILGDMGDNTPSFFRIRAIYFLLAWAAIGLTGSLILTGRRSLVVTAFIAVFIWPLPMAIAEGLDAPQLILDVLLTLKAWLFILGIIGGTVAAFVYGTLKKRISRYVTYAAVLGYILVSLINLEVIWGASSLEELSIRLMLQDSATLESFVLMTVLVLPLAPLAAAPLALAWNRHR